MILGLSLLCTLSVAHVACSPGAESTSGQRSQEKGKVPCPAERCREPIQFMLELNLESDAAWAQQVFDIPAGKRLHIEYLSADVRLPPDQRGIIILNTRPNFLTNRPSVPFHFALTAIGTHISVGPHARSHYVSQRTRLFSEEKLEIIFHRGPTPGFTGKAFARVGVSGYIVDIP